MNKKELEHKVAVAQIHNRIDSDPILKKQVNDSISPGVLELQQMQEMLNAKIAQHIDGFICSIHTDLQGKSAEYKEKFYEENNINGGFAEKYQQMGGTVLLYLYHNKKTDEKACLRIFMKAEKNSDPTSADKVIFKVTAEEVPIPKHMQVLSN